MKNSGWEYCNGIINVFYSYLKKFLFIIIICRSLFVPAEAAFSKKENVPEIKKDILPVEIKHNQTVFVTV